MTASIIFEYKMKYSKQIIASFLIYIAFFLAKILLVNRLVNENSPANPMIKLGLDCAWLASTIYVWRMLTKKTTQRK
jgi:hypothetical protein